MKTRHLLRCAPRVFLRRTIVRLGILSSRALQLTRFDRPSADRLVSRFAAASTLPPASLNEIR
jgi:hypothetical protein